MKNSLVHLSRRRMLPALAIIASLFGLFWLTGTPRNDVSAHNAPEVAGDLDTAYAPSLQGSGGSAALALQPDGKLLVGGVFDAVNNVNRVALGRLNADGSLDTTFTPALIQANFSDTLAEAVNDVRYQFKPQRQAAGQVALNPAQEWQAVFAGDSLQLAPASGPQDWQLNMTLRGYGYGANLTPVVTQRTVADGNRLELHKTAAGRPQDKITEWYINRPEGLEQGFTLAARPAGHENAGGAPLKLALAVSGDLRPEADADGQSVWLHDTSGTVSVSYSKLAVWDARGTTLPARMRADAETVYLEVDDQTATYPLTIDPTFAQQARLRSRPNIGEQYGYDFGFSVALSGDTAVVTEGFRTGAAYVFVRSGTRWNLQTTIYVDPLGDVSDEDYQDLNAAISGDTIILGLPSEELDEKANFDQGLSYVYVRSGTTWTRQARLVASDTVGFDYFGSSVALNGDTAVIGASGKDVGANDQQGAAYIFTRSGTTWTQQARLTANDGAANDFFGDAVAISGETVLIGRNDGFVSTGQPPTPPGSAYVFVRSGTTWTQQAKLVASDSVQNNFFGCSVALDGNTAVIGAHGGAFGSGTAAGASYVFVRSGTAWTQQARLTPNNSAARDSFGSAVTIEGETLVVGNQTFSATTQGAFVFTRFGTTWTQEQKLTPIGGVPSGFGNQELFGGAVALSGNTLLVGSSGGGGVLQNAGSVYVFVVVTGTAPAMSVSDPPVFESNSGLTTMPFTVTLSAASTQTVTVNYATANGTATAGSDYVATSGTLTFSAGETSKTINVMVNGDTQNEPDETILLNLTNATNATLIAMQGVGTIYNDDTPVVQFSASAYTANEGTGVATITVIRAGGDVTAPFTVGYQGGNTQSGAACNATSSFAEQRCDYTYTQGTLSFAANETSKTFTVPLVDDFYVETNELLDLSLSPGPGALLGTPAFVRLTITDNDTVTQTPRLFLARLNAAQEVPVNSSTATGLGRVLLSADETTAQVSLTFSGLGSAQTAAHIHGPAPVGTNAPVLFNLPNGTVTNQVINLTPAQVAQLKAGLFYFNVHTANFPNGEIRGQILSNPAENPRFFVRQQYADFLAREPDTGGFDYWTGEIANTGTDLNALTTRRREVSNAFFFELEYQQTGAYVYRLYRAAYGNTQPQPNPDAAFLPAYYTFAPDRAKVVGGAQLAQTQLALANEFTQTFDFTQKYPATLTGPQFVDAVLTTMQQASGANLSGQRDALINLLNSGGRGAVMYRLADDNAANPINNRAFIDAEYNRAFVATQYFGYLRRDADLGGFNFWLNIVNLFPLRDTRGQLAMVCAFITSAEYQERFGPYATRGNSECPSAP